MDKKDRLIREINDLNDWWRTSPEFRLHSKPEPDLVQILGATATLNTRFLPIRNGEYCPKEDRFLTHAIVSSDGYPLLALNRPEYILGQNIPLPPSISQSTIIAPDLLLMNRDMSEKDLEILHHHLTKPQKVGRQAIIDTLLRGADAVKSSFIDQGSSLVPVA